MGKEEGRAQKAPVEIELRIWVGTEARESCKEKELQTSAEGPCNNNKGYQVFDPSFFEYPRNFLSDSSVFCEEVLLT